MLVYLRYNNVLIIMVVRYKRKLCYNEFVGNLKTTLFYTGLRKIEKDDKLA